jgi:hypothetical protein
MTNQVGNKAILTTSVDPKKGQAMKPPTARATTWPLSSKLAKARKMLKARMNYPHKWNSWDVYAQWYCQ